MRTRYTFHLRSGRRLAMFTLYGDHDATPDAAAVLAAMLRESASIAAVQGEQLEVTIEQVDTRHPEELP